MKKINFLFGFIKFLIDFKFTEYEAKTYHGVSMIPARKAMPTLVYKL